MGRIRESAIGRKLPSVKNALSKDEIDRADSIVLNNTIEPPLDKLPKNIQPLQIWAQSQTRFINAGRSEMDWSPEDVADMYANRGKKQYMLGDIPLIVICRGDGGYKGFTDSVELEKERLKLQTELSHLSTNGKLIIDNRSGHNIHLEDPKAVVDAIKEVVRAVKENRLGEN